MNEGGKSADLALVHLKRAKNSLGVKQDRVRHGNWTIRIKIRSGWAGGWGRERRSPGMSGAHEVWNRSGRGSAKWPKP